MELLVQGRKVGVVATPMCHVATDVVSGIQVKDYQKRGLEVNAALAAFRADQLTVRPRPVRYERPIEDDFPDYD